MILFLIIIGLIVIWLLFGFISSYKEMSAELTEYRRKDSHHNQLIEKEKQEIEKTKKEINRLLWETERKEQAAYKKEQYYTKAVQNLDNLKEQYYADTVQTVNKLIEDRCNCYPHMAAVISDLLTVHYERAAQYLESKSHPAYTEAYRIRELRRETKALIKEKKEIEYKLAYIENLFPNINDIFDSGFNEQDFELETEENTDRVRLLLSEEEYRTLSISQRNQLALDRYVAGRKSKWQVGRDYEMFVGQQYEKQGYHVKYTGIIENIEDMGRDLIATKGNTILVVQCKNWAKEKTIHEKHIFQLFGTVVLYQDEHPRANVVGVFITTTQLSPKAKRIAKHLNIEFLENKPLGDFPRIKCNINRQTGEKIYHLPFDQQYDTAVIDQSGEFYASTVAEAEKKGFRRAFRHHSS